MRQKLWSSPLSASPQRAMRSAGMPISSRQMFHASSSSVYVVAPMRSNGILYTWVSNSDGPVDCLALEVVAEAPVTEHLEEGVMPWSAADFLEIVVLTRHAQAALDVDGALVTACFCAGQNVLELDHAGVGEQQRRIARGHEARARHDRVATLSEEVQKVLSDLRGGHAWNARIRDAEGLVWHGPKSRRKRPPTAGAPHLVWIPAALYTQGRDRRSCMPQSPRRRTSRSVSHITCPETGTNRCGPLDSCPAADEDRAF